MAHLLLALVQQPHAIALDILRKPGGAVPVLFEFTLFFSLRDGTDRRTIGEQRRDFDHRLVDQNGNRIQVRGKTFKSKSLPLQGERTAASEWVMEGWNVVGIE